jgi:hypothetical protein
VEATADRVHEDHPARPESAIGSGTVSAEVPNDPEDGLMDRVDAAPGFADLRPESREAWDRTAREDRDPLSGCDAARVHCGLETSPGSGSGRRFVTVVSDGAGAKVQGAAAWTVERLRAPFVGIRLASTAGSRCGVVPAPILFPRNASIAEASGAWRSMLEAVDRGIRPDALEVGPLPLDSAAWGGLLAAAEDVAGGSRIVASRTVGGWVRLPLGEGLEDGWRARLQKIQRRLRRDLGPERTRVFEEIAEIRSELHEADRMLRQRVAGGLDAVPQGRRLAEDLLKAAVAGDGRGVLAVRLELADRPIGRAIAIVDGDRAVVLLVACSRSQPWRSHAPGRLVFGRLLELLGERGVRTVEAGPAAMWFASGTPGAVTVPLQSLLLAPGGRRPDPVEHLTRLIAHLPRVGPFEPVVSRLRPWAEAIDQADSEPDAVEEADATNAPDASTEGHDASTPTTTATTTAPERPARRAA